MNKKSKQTGTVLVSKNFNIKEIELGITKIRRRIDDINKELIQNYVMYGDVRVEIVENKIVETLREVFGESSPEFKRFEDFGFVNSYLLFNNSDGECQQEFQKALPKTITRLVGLIEYLEEKKLDLDASDDQVLEDNSPSTKVNLRINNKVFVIHGRNDKLRRAMFDFLRSIGLEPMEWNELVSLTKKGSPHISEILDAAFNEAQAIIALLTPDDEARLLDQFHGANEKSHESNLTPQARPNVLFETGMAMGRDESRTIIVEIGNLRPFSDIDGINVVRFDGSGGKRNDLVQRLTTAGCKPNTKGSDWLHSGGDFSV